MPHFTLTGRHASFREMALRWPEAIPAGPEPKTRRRYRCSRTFALGAARGATTHLGCPLASRTASSTKRMNRLGARASTAGRAFCPSSWPCHRNPPRFATSPSFCPTRSPATSNGQESPRVPEAFHSIYNGTLQEPPKHLLVTVAGPTYSLNQFVGPWATAQVSRVRHCHHQGPQRRRAMG